MNIVIYLIDDNLEEAKSTIKKLNDFASKKYRNEEYSFRFKFLEGTVNESCYGQDMKFYDTKVIEDIRSKMKEEEGEDNIMGILLDILLTRQDIEFSRSKYYPKASIARDIYNEFNEVMPIYIITSILNFGTQSDIIMGVELRDFFILKDSLDYPGDVYVKSMFDKYIEMYKRQRC